MGRREELLEAQAIEITTRSGSLVVIAEPGRSDVEVEGLQDQSRKEQVWRDGSCLHIRSGSGSSSITVRCPPRTDLMAASDSGEVTLRGELGHVRLFSYSGMLSVERARSVEARTTNGGIRIDTALGRVAASTTSGRVEIQEADSARAASVSGSIDLRNVRAKAEAMSVSGSIKLASQGSDTIRLRTVSGGVDVRVPMDRQPNVRMRHKSGSLKITCAQGDDFSILIETVSGAVHVGNHRSTVES